MWRLLLTERGSEYRWEARVAADLAPDPAHHGEGQAIPIWLVCVNPRIKGAGPDADHPVDRWLVRAPAAVACAKMGSFTRSARTRR